MTITFTPKPNQIEVKVEGYGKIKVRPYGAGEELQIAKNIRELDELQKKLESWYKGIKDKYGDDESKITEEEKTEFDKIQGKLTKLSGDLTDLIRSTISSNEKGVAERLFNELSMNEIRRLINTALGKEEDAKA